MPEWSPSRRAGRSRELSPYERRDRNYWQGLAEKLAPACVAMRRPTLAQMRHEITRASALSECIWKLVRPNRTYSVPVIGLTDPCGWRVWRREPPNFQWRRHLCAAEARGAVSDELTFDFMPGPSWPPFVAPGYQGYPWVWPVRPAPAFAPSRPADRARGDLMAVGPAGRAIGPLGHVSPNRRSRSTSAHDLASEASSSQAPDQSLVQVLPSVLIETGKRRRGRGVGSVGQAGDHGDGATSGRTGPR